MKHLIFGPATSTKVQFFRYLFVGGSSAVIDLVAFAYFTESLNIHYMMSAFLAYTLGLFWNHILGILWVFQSKHNRKKEFLMVFFISFGGLLWTELLLYIFISLMGIHGVLAKFISQWIVLFWNFGMRKLYVFH